MGRTEFSDAARIRAESGLRVGVPDLPYLHQLIEREFPNVQVVPVPLPDPANFAARPSGVGLDAVCLTAERGSFLTFVRPEYSVAVPHPLDIRQPVAYPVARRDLAMARFLGLWIDLKRKDGTIQPSLLNARSMTNLGLSGQRGGPRRGRDWSPWDNRQPWSSHPGGRWPREIGGRPTS